MIKKLITINIFLHIYSLYMDKFYHQFSFNFSMPLEPYSENPLVSSDQIIFYY